VSYMPSPSPWFDHPNIWWRVQDACLLCKQSVSANQTCLNGVWVLICISLPDVTKKDVSWYRDGRPHESLKMTLRNADSWRHLRQVQSTTVLRLSWPVDGMYGGVDGLLPLKRRGLCTTCQQYYTHHIRTATTLITSLPIDW
jgi:hypothetical protein